MDTQAAEAALIWQYELGATDAIGDAPVNSYDLPKKLPHEQTAAVKRGMKKAVKTPAAPSATGVLKANHVAEANALAKGADSLADLSAAMGNFEGCELKRGARNLVFADGSPDARVMIIGEAPGREEDRDGRPFVGRAGLLLDRMFAAIGLRRDDPDPAGSLYITNIMPWRPPHNRTPTVGEIAVMRPFLERHVALAAPDILVLMGNPACEALLGQKGITRLRGHWAEVLGRPALPMVHPAYLLRTPEAKRAAWHDLLALKSKLEGEG